MEEKEENYEKEREGKEALLTGLWSQKDGFKSQLYTFPTLHFT